MWMVSKFVTTFLASMSSLRSDVVTQSVVRCLSVPLFLLWSIRSKPWCFNVSSVSPLLHQYFTGVSQVFRQSFTSVSPMFHQCFTSVSQVFCQCFASVLPMFRQCLPNVLPVFHQCFTSVSSVFRVFFSLFWQGGTQGGGTSPIGIFL